MSEIKLMEEKYKDYYTCPTESCDSIYHVSNFFKDKFECRDCKQTSKVPKEALKSANKFK